MRIKRLEIKGFKSFPDKTVLELKPGITAIVGPNGCGKSNVFEAIRWVMGEQSARVLRGKKMEDVIFNGSDSRKPVGMGEVRLVLSNDGGSFSGSMADYDEVMISRRLFRGGESQYEINGIPCRLSDVTDFFLDTGVGRNSYAVIEQGRVDMVVASRPEDRRVLIEEAAGINRYKARREAAIKKLEQTNQNLLRISDVIREVRRQGASLKRQASQAERYRKLSERHRSLDIAFHAHRCARQTEEHSRIGAELERNRTLFLEKQARFASIQAELEQVRLKALDAEKALSDLLESHHKVDLELAAVRGSVERDRAALVRLAESRERDSGERTSLESQLHESRERRSALETQIAALLTELHAAQEELRLAGEKKCSLDRTLGEQRELWERLKDEVFRTLQEAASERNAREQLNRRAAEIKGRLERIGREADEVARAVALERTRREELLQKSAEITQRMKDEAGNKERLSAERVELQHAIELLRERSATYEREVTAARARRESLEELQQSYSSYDDGVRFLMQDRVSAAEKGLLGPLAELLDVPEKYQKAVIAALGDRLGYVVVDSPRAGAAAADLLREAEAGRSTFIPRSPRTGHEHSSTDGIDGLVQLKDVARLPEGLEDLEDFLLGRSVVVEDMRSALEIWEKNGISVDLATLSGELVNRHGEITGGSGSRAGEEVFEKRREIARLGGEIDHLNRQISDVRAELARHEDRLRECVEAVSRADAALNNLRVAETALRKDLERVGSQIADFERRLSVLALEKDRLDKEIESQSSQVRSTEENIARLGTRHAELERLREEARRGIDACSVAREEESRHYGETRVHVAQMEERHQALERERRTLDAVVEQISARMKSLSERLEHYADDEKRLHGRIEDASLQERRLMTEHADQARRIEGLKNDSTELAARLMHLEAAAAAEGKALAEVRERVHSLEMESVRVEQVLEGLVEKIIDRYRVDPRTVAVEDDPPNEQEIGELRSKLDAMGEVNLAAIAESRLMEERLTFLTEQESDLRSAVESLYATINRINKTTKERFRAAFDSINEKFQEIFPFLFRGGEARLVLTDEDNLLETGVDIMARPPGKRVRNMDLLSGGEKALTAVALIFSIFLTRPSPFCLLDEVDAPLDDSNILRFNEMLRRLADQTQFLVITHNKRSMETADTLYGVTMEEAGVSTVVSVEFV
ncbi:MAG: chromosome segregation protein SMC [Desulfomonile sp.]|nr:chromosome segregation protein SMC [Desulfomonile sp.]